MNKKGVITDIIVFVLVILLFAVGVVVGNYVLTSFNDVVQSDSNLDATSKDTVNSMVSRIPAALDGGVVFIFIAAHIGIIILGISLRTYPIIYPILFIALVIISVLAAGVSNAWDTFASDPEMVTYAASQPIISWIMDNLVMLMLGFGVLDIIIFLGVAAIMPSGGGIY